MRPRRGTAIEEPEQFEPGSEGPVVPLAYALAGTAVVLAGGVTVLLMLAGPGVGGPFRSGAHRLWTYAARVASFGIVDQTTDCDVPFCGPDMNVSLALDCAWAFPVNLAAALIATACLRYFRGLKESCDGLRR